MDGEMSNSVRVAVTMLVVGAVLSILIVSIRYGQGFYGSMLSTISDGVSYSYAAELDAIMEYNDAIPAASVYLALEKNRAAIRSVSGTAHSITVHSIDDIQKLFKYEIKCTINRNGEQYDVVITQ